MRKKLIRKAQLGLNTNTLTFGNWALPSNNFLPNPTTTNADYFDSLGWSNTQQQFGDDNEFSTPDYGLFDNSIRQQFDVQIPSIETKLPDLSSLNIGQTIQNIKFDAAQTQKEISRLNEVGLPSAGNKLAKQQKTAGIMGYVGAAADLVGSFMPEKTEYSGTKGDVTQGIDAAYDGISDMAMSLGPVGMIVGGAMKGASLLGKGFNAMGAGTDGMTTQDAILGSNFFSWNVGAINGALGSTADTITKNNLAFEQVGASYSGSNSTIDDALIKSGKKYGVLSQGAKRKANREIAEAKRQQSIIEDISELASERFDLRNSMAAINGNRRRFQMQGGYDQSAVRVGKNGMSIKDLQRAWRIVSSAKYQNGGIAQGDSKHNGTPVKTRKTKEQKQVLIQEPTQQFKQGGELTISEQLVEVSIDSIPTEYMDNALAEIDINDLLPEFKEGGQLIAPDTEVDNTLTEVDINELLPEFKKGGNIKENIKKDDKFDNYDNVIDFYKDYDLSGVNFIIDDNPRTEGNNLYIKDDEDAIHELWHYISQNKPNEQYKEWYDDLDDNKIEQFGGNLQFVKRTGDPSEFYNPSELEARIKAALYKTKGNNYTKEFFQYLRNDENKYGNNMRDLLYMFNDDNLVKIFNVNPELFKEGGKFNVIPEGALHARKHNMDIEGITTKGIPVVSETEDGQIEQQAEIEREEIIFRLEVTKKLEELAKDGSDEAAIEAGKLLVEEILYNTIDNTNSLI